MAVRTRILILIHKLPWRWIIYLASVHFIALIHPIQWTFANPVGTDRPAKRQKKPSCVSTGWPVPLCIHQVAHHTSFLSRQHDVITSFSFGACSVQTDFCELTFSLDIGENIVIFIISVVPTDICQYIEHNVFTWSEVRRMWPCYGEF